MKAATTTNTSAKKPLARVRQLDETPIGLHSWRVKNAKKIPLLDELRRYRMSKSDTHAAVPFWGLLNARGPLAQRALNWEARPAVALIPMGGSIMAITPWLHYADHRWLRHADHRLAPICRSVTTYDAAQGRKFRVIGRKGRAQAQAAPKSANEATHSSGTLCILAPGSIVKRPAILQSTPKVLARLPSGLT